MFDRRVHPIRHLSFAASAALVVLIAGLTSPAQAATPTQIACPDTAKATLELPAHLYTTALVSNNLSVSALDDEKIAAIEQLESASASSLLAPRAEAAIRNAFLAGSGTNAKPDTAAEGAEDDGVDAAMITRLPGISDEDFARYKKRMYRRDI